MSIFGNQIRKRVMQVVDNKIKAAQTAYEADVEKLEEKLKLDKEAALERHVQNITGNII